jgi:hypothetical protein
MLQANFTPMELGNLLAWTWPLKCQKLDASAARNATAESVLTKLEVMAKGLTWNIMSATAAARGRQLRWRPSTTPKGHLVINDFALTI